MPIDRLPGSVNVYNTFERTAFDKINELADVAGGAADAITAETGIANTETVLASLDVDANELAVGDTFIFEAFATQNGTNAAQPVVRVRIGPTTLLGEIAATITGITGSGGNHSQFRGTVTIRSIGATGTALGSIVHTKSDGAGYDFVSRSVPTAPVTIDTTVANKVEVTVISGNAAVTYNFQQAFLKKL